MYTSLSKISNHGYSILGIEFDLALGKNFNSIDLELEYILKNLLKYFALEDLGRCDHAIIISPSTANLWRIPYPFLNRDFKKYGPVLTQWAYPNYMFIWRGQSLAKQLCYIERFEDEKQSFENLFMIAKQIENNLFQIALKLVSNDCWIKGHLLETIDSKVLLISDHEEYLILESINLFESGYKLIANGHIPVDLAHNTFIPCQRTWHLTEKLKNNSKLGKYGKILGDCLIIDDNYVKHSSSSLALDEIVLIVDEIQEKFSYSVEQKKSLGMQYLISTSSNLMKKELIRNYDQLFGSINLKLINGCDLLKNAYV